MTTLVCSHVGCNTFCISGAALSGKHEGDARNTLLEMCDEAKRVALSNDRPSVLVMDDMDKGIAALGENTGHTINSGLLVGALHDLANDVQNAGANHPYLRTPIIMTGNNFLCLPETLVRPGRTRFFEWRPTSEEKANMVLPLFGNRSWLEVQRLRELVRRYHVKGEPLAFYVELIGDYIAQSGEQGNDCTDIPQSARLFDEVTATALDQLDFGLLNRLARRLHRNKARSYLRKDTGHA